MSVMALWCQGMTDEAIAANLQIPKDQAAYWRRECQRHVMHEAADKTTQLAQQKAMLDLIAREAIAAWMRSKQSKTSTVKEQVDDASTIEDGKPRVTPSGEARGGGGRKGKRTRIKLTAEESAGESAYLREARAALADLRDLFGLDAVKTAVLHVVINGKALDLTDTAALMQLSRQELEDAARQAGLPLALPPAPEDVRARLEQERTDGKV